LIALGLATNTAFVQKALQVLNPKKFKGGFDGQELTMKEFTGIFKTDPISEKFIKLFKKRLEDENGAKPDEGQQSSNVNLDRMDTMKVKDKDNSPELVKGTTLTTINEWADSFAIENLVDIHNVLQNGQERRG
jgi:hypothetical protein